MIPNEILAVLCRELNQLYRSGVSVAEGLRMLGEGEKDKRILSALNTAYERMSNGDSLADALRQEGHPFPDYMVDVLDLAEQTGKLEDSLLALSRHYDRQVQISNDLRSAFAVPIALLLVMCAVVVLLVTQVLPVFDRVFTQMGVQMGAAATSLIGFGRALSKMGTGLMAAACVLAVIAAVIFFVPSLRAKAKVWFFGLMGNTKLFMQTASAQFASALALAVSSGLYMDQAVEMAGRIVKGSKPIEKRVSDCKQALTDGKGVAEALTDSGLFPERECKLVELGELAGTLPQVLNDLAARQEEDSFRRIDRLLGTIEPSIVVIASAMMGVILLSVMLPLMGLLSAMG